jgi:hypothetical protein
MLWYKAWLETRIRLWVTFGYTAIFLALLRIRTLAPAALPPPRSNPAAGLAMGMISFITVICALLAGSGIASQASFQAIKGLHGSTQFTLSLPVSRLRLIMVRAGLGWLEMACAIGMFCGGLRFAAPALAPGAKPGDLFAYTVSAIACASALYFASVLLAIFMDDQWRMGGTMLVAACLWLVLPNLTPLPVYADVLRALGEGSPLAAHTVPCPAVAVSVALALILFAAAVKAARTREY